MDEWISIMYFNTHEKREVMKMTTTEMRGDIKKRGSVLTLFACFPGETFPTDIAARRYSYDPFFAPPIQNLKYPIKLNSDFTS